MYEYDSRKIRVGNIFLCLPKAESFCSDALKNGAKDIIKCSRAEMAELVHKHYNYPSSKLNVIGVTGTNGKSSVTSFVHQALLYLGKKSMLQGTLSSNLTTPESLDTIRSMTTHIQDGGDYFVMEVSSHGIDQDRILGIEFDVKCLTNISQDHLDYHKTFDAYKKVKHKFMNEYSGESIFPDDFKCLDSIKNAYVLGGFNQENLKAALKILLSLGFSKEDSIKALTNVHPPEGRFESIPLSSHKYVFVDYAHSPDGLRVVCNEALHIAKQNKGKLFVCFGCGGDRDRTKRKLMAKEACSVADYIMITQDNPRHEDPVQIIQDILEGVSADVTYEVEHDRKRAIEQVLRISSRDDVVLIAGKGHEDYQIIGSERIYFKDKDVVLNWHENEFVL